MSVKEVQDKCIAEGWTLSTAESCTGGAIAAALVKRAGASNYFAGSVVAYSNTLKMNFLGVKEKTLTEHGAVSEQTAIEMVAGLLAHTKTTFGIAVTGIAGPDGGTDEKPVGTVCIAIARQEEQPKVKTYHFAGTREAIIEQTVTQALELLMGNMD